MSSLPGNLKKPDHLRIQRDVYDMLKRDCVQEGAEFHGIEDIRCDEYAKNYLKELGLTQTKAEGIAKIGYLNVLLQHATGDYSQESLPDAGPVLETILENLEFEKRT